MTSMVCSLDGTLLAVLRDSELSLFTVEPFALAARITIPGPVASPVMPVFIGNRHLLVHGIVGERTHLTLLTLPRMTLVSQLELEAPTRCVAATHQYVLLDRGDDAFVATCTATAAAVAPLRLPIKIAHAIALEQPQFLTWSSRGAEIWDAASRRPAARVALELPRGVNYVGVTGQNRQIWVASVAPELVVMRLSDGRTLNVALPGTPERVTSHPMSSWVIADIGGRAHGINVALRTCAPVEVPLGIARAMVPVPGVDTDAYVFVDDGDKLERTTVTLDPATSGTRRGLSIRLEPIGAAPAPLPEPTPPAPSSMVDPPRPRPKAAEAPPAPKPAPQPVKPAPAPQPSPSGGKSSIAERVAKMGQPAAPVAAAPVPVPVPVPDRLNRKTVSVTYDWRDALLSWSRSIAAGTHGEAIPAGRSPLVHLAERGELGIAAARMLHLLYADWLSGRGDTGVPALALAEVGGAADAWAEALATGRLGALGLVRSELGRTRLVPAVGTFLDGRPAESFERIGVRDAGETGEGIFRVAAGSDEPGARATAARLSATLGQVGFVDDAAVLDTARLEAWLRELALVLPHDLADLSPFDLRPRETVLLVAPADAVDDDGPPFFTP